jgi:hypothetical protein
MLIIGCDYHPSWQQICWLDTETGETEERKLDHSSGEAERFYRGLRSYRGAPGKSIPPLGLKSSVSDRVRS